MTVLEQRGEARVIEYTSYNEFYKGRKKALPVNRFLLELTQHMPPR
jgi:hypothetical protein